MVLEILERSTHLTHKIIPPPPTLCDVIDHPPNNSVFLFLIA